MVRTLLAIGAMLLAQATVAQAETITITDDVGREVTLDVPVKRAVVFNRYNAEFFRALAGQDVLVGLDRNHAFKHEGYWPGLTEEVIAGESQQEPNFEKVVSLRPDIVVFARNGAWEKAAEKLEPFGIPVVVITGWDVEKHRQNVELVGRLVGAPERAKELNTLHARYDGLVDERLAGKELRSVYLEKTVDYTTSLQGSGWHDMLVEGGGRNIFGDIVFAEQPKTKGNVHQFEIDPEGVLRADPEVIIKQIGDSYIPPSEEEMRAAIDALKARPGWDQLQAVRNDRVYILTYFGAGAMSKLVGKLYTAKWLFPELFADVDPAEVMRIWLEDYQGVPYPGAYAYPTQ